MRANTLWAVVERSNDGDSGFVLAEEVFYSRSEARQYLQSVKRDSFTPNPRNLFIRQLRVTNRRG
jgi:hypothetical protein